MIRNANLWDNAALTSPDHRLITIIGAGGKTSLVGWLAQQKQLTQQQVIITTTTKIFPLQNVYTVLQEEDPDFLNRVCHALNNHSCIVVAHRFDAKTGKLIGLSTNAITLLHESGMADTIFVEADGAAHKPLKAPAIHEPVIPLASDICIGVMGLDAVYRPLTEANVHRHEIFSKIAGLAPGELITPAHMVRVATAPNGLFKGSPPDSELAVLLNKSDIPGGSDLIDEFKSILSHEKQSQHFKWFAGSVRQQRIKRINHRPCKTQDYIDFRLEFSHQF